MNDNTLEQLVELVRSRYYGKYRGTVIDTEDSQKLGRVKVSVPAVLGDLQIWAMPCVPYTGSNAGHYFIPEVGAGIWVEFEAGDASYPIWVGGYWGDGDTPQNEKGADPKPAVKVLRTKSGLIVSLDDDAQVVTLSDGDNGNFITIEVTEGKIKLNAKTKVVVEAPQIELVEGASHPVVFGDDLLNYLNQICQLYQSHTHPGEMALGVLPVTPAPPVPPFTPPPASMLSTKVKTG
jgi:hypothetical protein